MKPTIGFLCVLLTAQFAQAQTPPRSAQPEGQAVVLAPNQDRPSPPGLAIKLSRELQRGDVITRGNRVNRAPNGREDGCEVNFGVETPKFRAGNYTITMVADDDCPIKVDDIIDRTDAATTLQAALQRTGPLAALVSRVIEWFEPRLSAATGPKRITGYTWMYGYGGTWDMLSEERGFHDFTWDGNYVWTNAAYGYCEAHNSTFWWMNGCWIYSAQYSGQMVSRQDYGNFFWAPAGLAGPHILRAYALELPTS